jgi:four helix bundle protein
MGGRMRDFKQLKVWEKAHGLALDVYRATSEYPAEECLGLTSLLRRAVVSVPSNIAEGCGRDGNRELTHFMSMAAGSASEVECQLLLARDLGFVSKELHGHLDCQTTEVKRTLYSFMKKLNLPDA